jgi:hypothetical protein
MPKTFCAGSIHWDSTMYLGKQPKKEHARGLNNDDLLRGSAYMNVNDGHI